MCFALALEHVVVNYFHRDWKRLVHDNLTVDHNALAVKANFSQQRRVIIGRTTIRDNGRRLQREGPSGGHGGGSGLDCRVSEE